MAGISAVASAVTPALGQVADNLQRQRAQSQTQQVEASRWDHERQAREHEALLKQQAQERQWEQDRKVREIELAQQQANAMELAQQQQQARERQIDLLRQEQSAASTQLRQGQAETLRAQEADTRNRLTQIDETARTDETQRRDALRRSMARTRASLGARGIGTADGSGEAVLTGMVGEADQERQASQAGDRLRRQALTQSVEEQRRRNLLEQTQLAERQRLEMLSRLY